MRTDDPLNYPMRRYGMDHDRYVWSLLAERAPVQWPDGKRLALWVNLSLQHFPLKPRGTPVKLPGNMSMPYPDLRHFSLRDYGHRVGLFRVLAACRRYGVTPSLAVNARLLERHPALAARLAREGGEWLGHGWDMDHPHVSGVNADTEAEWIHRSLQRLRQASGQAIRGWLSPGKLNSAHTPDLLKQAGLDWFCDWVNDELPYAFRTAHGPLHALPLSTELEDRFVLLDNLHSAESWAEQVIDACALLRAEAAEEGGRILSLNLHPWVIGQPHRIGYLERVLEAVTAHADVWCAGPSQILDAWRAQQPA
jgi:allantoinase